MLEGDFGGRCGGKGFYKTLEFWFIRIFNSSFKGVNPVGWIGWELVKLIFWCGTITFLYIGWFWMTNFCCGCIKLTCWL